MATYVPHNRLSKCNLKLQMSNELFSVLWLKPRPCFYSRVIDIDAEDVVWQDDVHQVGVPHVVTKDEQVLPVNKKTKVGNLNLRCQ